MWRGKEGGSSRESCVGRVVALRLSLVSSSLVWSGFSRTLQVHEVQKKSVRVESSRRRERESAIPTVEDVEAEWKEGRKEGVRWGGHVSV